MCVSLYMPVLMRVSADPGVCLCCIEHISVGSIVGHSHCLHVIDSVLARARDTNGTKLICPRSEGGNDLLFPIISWSEVSDLSPLRPLLVMQTEQKDGD